MKSERIQCRGDNKKYLIKLKESGCWNIKKKYLIELESSELEHRKNI